MRRCALQHAEQCGLSVDQIEQSTRHSQFEHLRCLTLRYAHAPPKWVIFSDDDDIWSETRAQLYEEQCAAAPPSVRAVLCRRKTVPLQSRGAAEAADAPSVRALCRAGHARYTDANAKDGLQEKEHNLAEYFDYAVRFETLARFFDGVPRCVVAHKLCDMALAFVLNKGGMSTLRFMPDAQQEFVYYYARGGRAGGASNTIPVGTEEEAFFEAQFARAPAAVQQLFANNLIQKGDHRSRREIAHQSATWWAVHRP